METVSEKN